MGFGAEVKDGGEMSIVDVSKHAKEFTINLLGESREVGRELISCLCRENGFVVDYILDPGHHIVDIARCRDGGLLAMMRIRPEIFDPKINLSDDTWIRL